MRFFSGEKCGEGRVNRLSFICNSAYSIYICKYLFKGRHLRTLFPDFQALLTRGILWDLVMRRWVNGR